MSSFNSKSLTTPNMAAGMEEVAKVGEHIDRQLAETETAAALAEHQLQRLRQAITDQPLSQSTRNIRGLLRGVRELCRNVRTFKDLMVSGLCQLGNSTDLEVQRLTGQLTRQQAINKNMKRQVLQLNELITDHIHMSRKKIQEKDQEIARLRFQRAGAAEIGAEEQKDDREAMYRTSLDTIKEEEEINNSNIKTSDRKEDSNMGVSDVKLDALSIRHSRVDNNSANMSVSSAIRIEVSPTEKEKQRRTQESSERHRSNSRTKVRFFIDDFRKASETVEDATIIGSAVPCQRKKATNFGRSDGTQTSNLLPVYHEVVLNNEMNSQPSATISGSSSHSHLSVAQNENDGLWTPYKDISPKKQDFTRNKRKPVRRCEQQDISETKQVANLQSLESCVVSLVEYSSSSLPKNRSGRREKLQVTQKDISEGQPSPHFLRAASKEKLKDVDTNTNSYKSLNSRPSSKEKLTVTIKGNTDINTQQSADFQVVNRPRKSGSLKNELPQDISQYLLKLDLHIGSCQENMRYEGGRRNGMRNGKGRLELSSSMVYEGDFKDNVRHGYGMLFVNKKEVYGGQWQQDKMCGQGTIKYMHLIHRPDKLNDAKFLSFLRDTWYTGEFQENKFHGTGTLHIGSDKITGKFHDGLPQRENIFYRRAEQEHLEAAQVPRRPLGPSLRR